MKSQQGKEKPERLTYHGMPVENILHIADHALHLGVQRGVLPFPVSSGVLKMALPCQHFPILAVVKEDGEVGSRRLETDTRSDLRSVVF